MKSLEKIKHGEKVVNNLKGNGLFFVEDIRRTTGLDEKMLRRTLGSLLKNGYLMKNDRGQWYVPEEETESN